MWIESHALVLEKALDIILSGKKAHMKIQGQVSYILKVIGVALSGGVWGWLMWDYRGRRGLSWPEAVMIWMPILGWVVSVAAYIGLLLRRPYASKISSLLLVAGAIAGAVVGYTGWNYLEPFLGYYLETHWIIVILPGLAMGWSVGVGLGGLLLLASGARSKTLSVWAAAVLFWVGAILGGCADFALNGMDYMTWPEIIIGSAYFGAGFGGLISLFLLIGFAGQRAWRSIQPRRSATV